MLFSAFIEFVERNFVEAVTHGLAFHYIVVVGPYQPNPELFQSFQPIIVFF